MTMLQRLFTVSLIFIFSPLAAAERPNIVWITAEDMSPTLGCYGDQYAITPNIDRLATQSVRYTHAFATAPVCSPSRSCLITGCYATSLGTQHMRSAFPIPDFIKGFPSYLREAGYYTTNNVKTDYNTANWKEIVAASWDESSTTAHWRNRPNNSQPFFSIFNLMTSHQSRTMVWPYEQFVKDIQSRLGADEIHDAAEAPLPPYYPDTPIIRRTVARFYDCVTAMDKEVGAILAQLDEDGLADETIVFFYSDHGSGMPRHKRALLDSGMHVPLLVRFPEKWKHLAPAASGATTDWLVSFVDFGPTVLSLAGVDIPDYMQGKSFLGEAQTDPREYVFGHRDRVDEVRDLARSIRSKRYLYIRNYMPHLGYNQPTAWPDQGEIRHEFYRLTDRNTMTDAQWQFAASTRPVHELYDCETDPLNLNNLAGSNSHGQILARMADDLFNHLLETRDVGFFPESETVRMFAGTTAWEYMRRGAADPRPLIAANAFGRNEEVLVRGLLTSPMPVFRYWAAIGLAAQNSIADAHRAQIARALDDESMAVRIEAANALARHGDVDQAIPVLNEALQHEDLTVVLHAARTIELLGQTARAAEPAMRQVLARAEKIRPPATPVTVVTSGAQDMAMFIGFAANAFLTRLGGDKWIDLFDGKTLDGWKALAEGEVTVENGEIRILAKGKNLWLIHDAEYDDFELQVEAKMPAGQYNSGIGFRCTGQTGKPKGYQCEIDRDKSGMIYAIGSGWVWPKGKEETVRFHKMAGDSFKDGRWNKIRIRCQGDHIEIWVNDVQTANVHDDRFRRGSVSLQHHGKGDVHQFRNVRLRPIE